MTPREEKRVVREEAQPGKLPETTPIYPGNQYDFVLQCVFDLRGTVGEQTRAISNLTELVKENDKKLDDVAKDVHAAKVVISVVGGLILLAAAFIGWLIHELLPLLSASRPPSM